MEKGFKTLELIGDLDDKYIYEASRPWKKTASFFPYTKELENSSRRGYIAYYGWRHIKVSGRGQSGITESNLLDRTGTGNREW